MDILCVSDTGGMILFGHKSIVSVSFDEVMMMSKAIDRGSKYGLRMVDMPYWSFHVSPEQAVTNAGRFVHEANAEVMKCEGNKHHAKNIEAIVRAGIPVQGHIGITPMRMPQLGGFVAQGKTAKRAKEIVEDAKAMVDAGCFSILCEVTTSEVAGISGTDAAGSGNQPRRRQWRAWRPHYFFGSLPSLGGACAAPLAHVHRPHTDHGRRHLPIHEGRCDRRRPGREGNGLYEPGRVSFIRARHEVGTQGRRIAVGNQKTRLIARCSHIAPLAASFIDTGTSNARITTSVTKI